MVSKIVNALGKALFYWEKIFLKNIGLPAVIPSTSWIGQIFTAC
jgi:hypothetical protein